MKKLKTLENRIVVMAFLLCAGVSAVGQVTCSRAAIEKPVAIKSQMDYRTVQASIAQLAYALYTIHKNNPEYTYVHQMGEDGKVAAVSVIGIADAETAYTAATNLMTLELLGESVRTMDQKFLPPSDTKKKGNMSRKESERYQPQQPIREEKKIIDTDQLPVITFNDSAALE